MENSTKEKIINLYLSGKSSREIGKELNLGKTTILRVLRKNNIPTKKQCDFLLLEKSKIVELYNEGETLTSLSNIFKVSITAIHNVLKKAKIIRRTRKYNLNEHFFDIIDTKEKAYILGLLMADGYNDGYSIGLSLVEKDRHILEQIKNIMQYDGPLYLKNQKKYNINAENHVSLEMGSKKLCITAANIGFVRAKTYVAKFPDINPSLYSSFIRGYFDGDGCIYMNKYNDMTFSIIGTKHMLDKIKEIINNTFDFKDVKLCRDKRVDDRIFTFQTGGNQKVKKIMNWMYFESTIHLNRKYEKYNSFINKLNK